MAKKLEYGLRLVKDRAGIEEFIVTGDAINNMEAYINDLIKRHYQDDISTNLDSSKEDRENLLE